MADDHGQFSDDISALWGAHDESALVPPRRGTSDQAFQEVEPTSTNGSQSGLAGDATDEGAARLAQALAANRPASSAWPSSTGRARRWKAPAAEGSAKLDDLSARLNSVQDDVAALRHAVAGNRWTRRRLGRSD